MEILIVEDANFRQNFFREKLRIGRIDCVKEADAGLERLKVKQYDVVFLDHDLIGAKSGSYLTERWYKNKDDFQTQKPIVIIHSMNRVGAEKMENYLKGVSKITELIPFRFIALGKVNIEEKVMALMKN